MPTIHFQVETELAPEAVMRVLTDFSEHRAEVWPNIDTAHFQVHESGPGHADVTEGSSVAGGIWERERYDWDPATGHVSVVTTDSNTWGPGSRWDYELRPRPGSGTTVDVRAVRNGIGVRGKLVGALLALTGRGRLRGDLESVLRRAAAASII
jgi:hypothetical protein